MKTLTEVHRLLPKARWWIKADGCDVISSLEESQRLVWNGDIDLGDGTCQKLHQEYLDNLDDVEKINFDGTDRQVILQLLSKRYDLLKNDLKFIYDGKLK